MQKVCNQCSVLFKTDDKNGKFCSQACYLEYKKLHKQEYVKHYFSRGHVPWNRDLKGIHLSPETEYKKGRISNRKLPVGTIVIRERARNQDSRRFIKIGNPNVWTEYAKYVWSNAHGKINKGNIIHHIDGNKLNDDLSNLMQVTRSEHAKIHATLLHHSRRCYSGATL